MANHPTNRSRRADAPGRSPKGSEVRALRDATGLSQTALGARLGVSLRTVQGWEADEVSMHPATWRYAQAVCSGSAEDWLARTHPDGWIHGGEKRLTWEMEQLLLQAYRAGQLATRC